VEKTRATTGLLNFQSWHEYNKIKASCKNSYPIHTSERYKVYAFRAFKFVFSAHFCKIGLFCKLRKYVSKLKQA